VYLLATLVIGLPVMIAEITLGRAARPTPSRRCKHWRRKIAAVWLIGAGGMLAAFLILSFYSEVVAWVFAYVFKAIGGSILSSDRHVTESAFGADQRSAAVAAMAMG
jgi:NSS family neurotransmitter:Na+ symporter